MVMTSIKEEEEIKPLIATCQTQTQPEPGSSRANGSASEGAESGYKLQQVLKPHVSAEYNIQALFNSLESGEIFLEPDYQRDIVWNAEKQSKLVDSILRSFPVFPFIFAKQQDPDGTARKVVIDGKQRLTAIYRFIKGEIPHIDPVIKDASGHKIKHWYTDDASGRKRDLLPDEYRIAFLSKALVAYEFDSLSDAEERAIFQRIQCGVALSKDEILQVLNSPRSAFVHDLVSKYNTEATLASSKLKWERKRGKGFRIFAQAVYLIARWEAVSGAGQEDTGASMVVLEKWLRETKNGESRGSRGRNGKGKKKASRREDFDDDDEDEDAKEENYDQLFEPIDGPEVPEDFKKNVRKALDTLVELTKDEALKRPFFDPNFSKISPIEMIFFILIVFLFGVRGVGAIDEGTNSLRVVFTPAQLSKAIYDFRAYVANPAIFPERKNRKDINTKLVEFIKAYRLPERRQSREPVAAPAPAAPAPAVPTPAALTPAAPASAAPASAASAPAVPVPTAFTPAAPAPAPPASAYYTSPSTASTTTRPAPASRPIPAPDPNPVHQRVMPMATTLPGVTTIPTPPPATASPTTVPNPVRHTTTTTGTTAQSQAPVRAPFPTPATVSPISNARPSTATAFLKRKRDAQDQALNDAGGFSSLSSSSRQKIARTEPTTRDQYNGANGAGPSLSSSSAMHAEFAPVPRANPGSSSLLAPATFSSHSAPAPTPAIRSPASASVSSPVSAPIRAPASTSLTTTTASIDRNSDEYLRAHMSLLNAMYSRPSHYSWCPSATTNLALTAPASNSSYYSRQTVPSSSLASSTVSPNPTSSAITINNNTSTFTPRAPTASSSMVLPQGVLDAPANVRVLLASFLPANSQPLQRQRLVDNNGSRYPELQASTPSQIVTVEAEVTGNSKVVLGRETEETPRMGTLSANSHFSDSFPSGVSPSFTSDKAAASLEAGGTEKAVRPIGEERGTSTKSKSRESTLTLRGTEHSLTNTNTSSTVVKTEEAQFSSSIPATTASSRVQRIATSGAPKPAPALIDLTLSDDNDDPPYAPASPAKKRKTTAKPVFVISSDDERPPTTLKPAQKPTPTTIPSKKRKTTARPAFPNGKVPKKLT